MQGIIQSVFGSTNNCINIIAIVLWFLILSDHTFQTSRGEYLTTSAEKVYISCQV